MLSSSSSFFKNSIKFIIFSVILKGERGKEEKGDETGRKTSEIKRKQSAG